ncbi:bifunctional phosphopantothenoylcysteine decarboxylase/phosphopantothenate--cysteine ligase CoaBC [Halodesulfurarchaeum formicicum]|uniref:Coenzyme A biosynthesis bifunctional protein CoaBC n=1 Tax=Halodesulfurarchaeum formicicum TaxID=1873524 RepID=A0A1J1ACB1_9EURY|nr:bifunctional phosphopantothenoylcysteine decarboxylase/phosphopantothenate--cysteine ligase CoaBC [Halodesulfurarchaeum formicicum]APE95517.1 phosphopantothenoylcysteine decarboxylase / phosphopantothenate--cysteine ligase [Halodesulfurarchaeum formicicum]
MLDGTNVALGVTGSVAAVTVVELAHELRRRGATVRALMTESAQGIVHPDAVTYATDEPVVTDLTGAVEHVELCGKDGWADVCLVAPATANTIGKIAGGIDDTPVTTGVTTALGAGIPVVLAPAMHEGMFDHPGVARNIETIAEWGVSVVPPRIEEGKAKIATADTIALETARAATDSPLTGSHVVVTSGATAEPIDPVRVLTNRASGRTGRAVARAIYVRGGSVTLLHNGGSVPYAEVQSVETAAEMTEAALEAAEDADAFVSAAAISDYTVDPAAEKLSSGESRTLELEPTPKLVDTIRDSYPDLPIVGFKVESDRDTLLDGAHELLDRVDMAFVVANHVDAMGGPETAVEFVFEERTAQFEGSKTALGEKVATELATVLE